MERKKEFFFKACLVDFQIFDSRKKEIHAKEDRKNKELRKIVRRVVKGVGTEMELIRRRKKEKDTAEIRLNE